MRLKVSYLSVSSFPRGLTQASIPQSFYITLNTSGISYRGALLQFLQATGFKGFGKLAIVGLIIITSVSVDILVYRLLEVLRGLEYIVSNVNVNLKANTTLLDLLYNQLILYYLTQPIQVVVQYIGFIQIEVYIPQITSAQLVRSTYLKSCRKNGLLIIFIRFYRFSRVT